jgi:hypothetical protein
MHEPPKPAGGVTRFVKKEQEVGEQAAVKTELG